MLHMANREQKLESDVRSRLTLLEAKVARGGGSESDHDEILSLKRALSFETDHSECGHTAGTDLAHCVHQDRSQLLIDAAFNAHDLNATALTEVRKMLRNTMALGPLTPADKEHLTSCIDTLNLCIIASRKLVKGEMP